MDSFNIKHISELPSLLPMKDFLIVGKGPSFFNWQDSYLEDYNVIGINQVSETISSKIGHFADYETFTDVEFLPEFVIVPALLNWRQNSMSGVLRNFMDHDYRLRSLEKQGRLFAYDIRVGPTTLFPETDPFIFKFRSGVMLTQICMSWGVKVMYTIGIDGGTGHTSKTFCNDINVLNCQIKLMHELALGNMEIIKL